jgi:hypothetical protein
MLARSAALAALTAKLCLIALLPACDEAGSDDPSAPLQKGASGSADASAEAVVIDLAFSAELTTSHCFSTRQTVQDQLLYTIGQLNGHNSVGRLDRLEISNLAQDSSGGACKLTYDARLPVAWGKKRNVPREVELILPRDMSYQGLERFTAAYKDSCVDWGAHDVDSGSLWYYFRPAARGCTFADADIVRTRAAVSVSPVNTTGKYPEYHKVWEDGALEVVAVFGKYKDGATSNDAGIDAYNSFIASIRRELAPFAPTTIPASVPTNPGVAVPDIEIAATLPGGKRVRVVALMVDNVRNGGAAFEARYESLSTRADLIVYNGHAGLGANVRALARMGEWVRGQYVIVFINGCDTYAYIDTALNEAHADVNPDDPEGTRYVDIVTNAMPSFFRSMSAATMAMVRGLLAHDEPRTYEKIFGDIDSAEVVIVTGEHDNTFVPGGDNPAPVDPSWRGLSERGALAANEDLRFATPKLPAGRYRFAISGSGDVDLYVRVGDAPSEDLYDCRPYLATSNEICEVDLAAPAEVHILLNAYGRAAEFELTGSIR